MTITSNGHDSVWLDKAPPAICFQLSSKLKMPCMACSMAKFAAISLLAILGSLLQGCSLSGNGGLTGKSSSSCDEDAYKACLTVASTIGDTCTKMRTTIQCLPDHGCCDHVVPEYAPKTEQEVLVEIVIPQFSGTCELTNACSGSGGSGGLSGGSSSSCDWAASTACVNNANSIADNCIKAQTGFQCIKDHSCCAWTAPQSQVTELEAIDVLIPQFSTCYDLTNPCK